MDRLHPKSFVLRALFLAIISSLVIVPAIAAQGEPAEMTPEQVVEKVGPAVVTVINQQEVGGVFGGGEPQQVGAGTGFIIDEEGHIVTNWHVVTGGTSFAVILSDGTQVPAELLGEDPRDDLAVVKIDPASVPATVPLGDSDALQPGQAVLAIGSPLGAFGNTVTMGIVSALNRSQLDDPTQSYCQNYAGLIQHDAAINQGNSGGPLFNLQGEVVGVNTLGIPISQGGVPVQGLFFAVPINIVKQVTDQLITEGGISMPYIGISLVPLNPQLASINELPVEQGIYVEEVEADSPADAAGLEPGDIVTAIDDNQITIENSLSQILIGYQGGDTASLSVLRDGETGSLDITFGEVDPAVFEQCTLQTGQ